MEDEKKLSPKEEEDYSRIQDVSISAWQTNKTAGVIVTLLIYCDLLAAVQQVQSS